MSHHESSAVPSKPSNMPGLTGAPVHYFQTVESFLFLDNDPVVAGRLRENTATHDEVEGLTKSPVGMKRWRKHSWTPTAVKNICTLGSLFTASMSTRLPLGSRNGSKYFSPWSASINVFTTATHVRPSLPGQTGCHFLTAWLRKHLLVFFSLEHNFCAFTLVCVFRRHYVSLPSHQTPAIFYFKRLTCIE